MTKTTVTKLKWECQTCQWSVEVDTPGFAGDGRFHYDYDASREIKCGPLVAHYVMTYEIGTEASYADGLVGDPQIP